MRTPILVFLGLLTACPKSSGPIEPLLVQSGPLEPALCVSRMSEEKRLNKKDAAVLAEAHAALAALDAEKARTLLMEASDHPAFQSARAAAALLLLDTEAAQAAYAALITTHPDDPCLLQAAAFNDMAIAAGKMGQGREAQADLDRALSRSRAAWSTEKSSTTGVLYAVLLLNGSAPEQAIDVLREVVNLEPDHPVANTMAGLLLLRTGDIDAALPYLTQARRLDVEGSDEYYLVANFLGKKLDAYLSTASEMKLPLGDDGKLATSESPLADYRAMLGYTEGQNLHARFETSLGNMDCTLYPERAPITVANFVHLARGTVDWTHPESGETGKRPLYDGTIFHRVIPGFMIQGGDPVGMGTGGPGYRFLDEIDPDLRFDRPALLAMANSGPNTNGSQFFITEVATDWLSGKHTIFGECTEESLALVKAMVAVERDERDRPVEPIVLERVVIEAR